MKFDAKAAKKRAKKRFAAIEKSQVQGLNRTADGLRSYLSKKGGPIKDELNIKDSSIRKRIAVLKASKGNKVAKVRIAGKPVPIIEAAARQTKKGVTVKVKGQGERKLIKGAFIAVMPTGHRGVFTRKGSKRLPIEEKYTTTVVQAVRGHGVARLITREKTRRYRKEYRAALKHNMSNVV